MSRKEVWINDDGLVVGSGAHKAGLLGATVSKGGSLGEYTLDIDLVEHNGITAGSGADTIQSDLYQNGWSVASKLPKDVEIVSVRAFVVEAAAGGTALNIGTYLYSEEDPRGSTISYDADGVLAAVPTATMAGEGVLIDVSAFDGAQVGSVISPNGNDWIVFGGFVTGVFTAGKIRISIEYRSVV